MTEESVRENKERELRFARARVASAGLDRDSVRTSEQTFGGHTVSVAEVDASLVAEDDIPALALVLLNSENPPNYVHYGGGSFAIGQTAKSRMPVESDGAEPQRVVKIGE